MGTVCLAMIVLLAGAAEAPGASPSAPAAVSAGREISAVALEPYEARWALTLLGGSRAQPIGTVTEKLELLEGEGQPSLACTRFADDPLGAVWQRVVFRSEGLAPVRHETTTGAGGAVRLDFQGAGVSGVRTETALGGAELPVEAWFDAPAFDADVLGLVLRSLPLAEGYHVRLPVYAAAQDVEGAAWVEVVVTGRELVADLAGRPAPAWVVEVGSGTPLASRFWIIDQAPYVARRITGGGAIEYRLLPVEQPS